MQTDVIPGVSVIIASHRSECISRCIASFGPAVWESVPVEIIVVADYPVDLYAVRFPSVIWVHNPDRSIPAKRNAGVVRARGEIVAFIDDDCRPCDKWISAAADFLDRNPAASAVEGMTLIETPDAPGASWREFKRLEKRGYRTNNIFYRRAALISAGMFDERFTVQREDLDLAFTLLERGHTIDYSENLKVMHSFRAGERWDLLKNCANRRFDPLLHRKHPALYRRHVGSPFPPSIMILLICHGATAAAVVFGRHAEAFLFLLDMIIILAMTIRRSRGAIINAAQCLREYIAYAVSPFVLLAALFYGSVRFRTFLIF